MPRRSFARIVVIVAAHATGIVAEGRGAAAIAGRDRAASVAGNAAISEVISEVAADKGADKAVADVRRAIVEVEAEVETGGLLLRDAETVKVGGARTDADPGATDRSARRWNGWRWTFDFCRTG